MTYDDVSSQDGTNDASTDTSTPFNPTDYTQVPFGSGKAQKPIGADSKPWLKQGGGNHGNGTAAAAGKNLVSMLVVVIVIIGMVVFSHHSSSSDSKPSSSNSSSPSSSQRKKANELSDNTDIAVKATDLLGHEVSDPENQVGQALYPIVDNVGINSQAGPIKQENIDKLKSATAKLANTKDDFTKTQAYGRYKNIRVAYKAYQNKKKDYIDVLNNFADSAIGYAATAKNCQENTMDLPIMGEDPGYLANTQNLITNCLTSAQSIAKSKDPIIKNYAQTAIDHMGVAQQQLDGIKALGSADDTYGDETKFQNYSSMEEKLGNNLYTAEQFGKQNPLYNELNNARPDKEMNDLYTSLQVIAQ